MIANIARKQARIGVLLREKFVFQLVIRQRDQNILILQQQILALQNNPPRNMAAIQDVMNAVALLLSQIPQYIGQEPPDDYFNKVMQVFTYGTQLGVVGFNNAIKTNILAGKMAGKFTPPNPFNNAAAAAVNTPALFIAWLQATYRAVKLGSAQASMRALMSDKFYPGIDIPDNYEKRIHLHVESMPFVDALPI